MSVTMNDTDHAIQVLTRGVEGLYSPQELQHKLDSGRKLRIKLGLDPTAPDIHLGHCIVLRKLRQFQDLGHTAVLIIGDYTAKIGDPTGRDATRPTLDDKTIKHNAQTYLKQAGKVLDLSKDKLEVRHNSQWLAKLTFAQTLSITSMVTVQQMLHRENFKLRMQSNTEIILSEFMYPLMQGYDSVAVNADVELGGTDQTFNNLIGRDLMAKHGLEKQVVMVMPILAGLDGHEKMSKSKGNYIALADPPDEMFGKVMSIPDTLMRDYFTLLTDLPEQSIQSLVNPDQNHPRDTKDVLARVIVELFHNGDAANTASAEFRRRFTEHQLPTNLQTKTTTQSPIKLIALIRQVGFASSNSEARRLVEQGGVSFGGQKITDPNANVQVQGEPVLKVGKRRVCKVVLALEG